jgi:hypothetical protein
MKGSEVATVDAVAQRARGRPCQRFHASTPRRRAAAQVMAGGQGVAAFGIVKPCGKRAWLGAAVMHGIW